VKAAWDESVKLTQNGMSAALVNFSTAWNVAFTTGSFATLACPSWMVGYIKSEAGAMTGKWSIAALPGGGGDWGGSYLAVPKGAAHPAEAADLIKWLTSADQEAAIFKAVGNFPSNSKAAAEPDVANATDAYFSGPDGKTPAPIGKIFGDSASKLVVAITGPHDGDIKDAITQGALTRVETGQQSANDSWNQLVSKDIPAVLG
jgi:cellobiose transport system substrate-binding protein